MVARRRGLVNGSPDLLVVGAGPTGLTVALQARAHGATVRVVERRAERFRRSRAMIMHPRTLEALREATERTIALLKERRSALIAAAVTGQLDVGTAA